MARKTAGPQTSKETREEFVGRLKKMRINALDNFSLEEFMAAFYLLVSDRMRNSKDGFIPEPEALRILEKKTELRRRS